jgi:hypothetical protein
MLLSERVVRHPITPLAHIWSMFIRNTAVANAVIDTSKPECGCGDFKDVYPKENLEVIKDNYAEIPAGIRPLLLGDVMHQIMKQAAFWSKRKFYPPVRLYHS